MGRTVTVDVREHSQEREWLLSLGHGNIVEGVQHLITQMNAEKNEAKYPSKGKQTPR